MVHSLRNILDYHCRAFAEGIGWKRILWPQRIYALVELTWMVFEAGSELKLVTDGLYLSPLLLFLLILMQA